MHVNTHAAWLPATVTSIAHGRIGVSYQTTQPTKLADSVAPWLVRPADGIRLQPVHAVRVGDDVVAFDGTTHTVCQCLAGQRPVVCHRLHHRRTGHCPPNAVLRLTDTTPAITVNGLPE